MATTQIQRVCLACGGIADDTHHGRSHDLSQGKGAGGTSLDDHEHFEYLPLCRKDHDRLHQKEIVITLHEGTARTQTADGELLGERPLAFDDNAIELVEDAEDFTSARRLMFAISDEGLAYLWENGERYAHQGYLYQCAVADAMHERYGGYGTKWYERAAQILGASPQTVYSRYRSWGYLAAVEEPTQEIARLGVATVEALGARARKGEPVTELADEADRLLAEGATRTAVATAVKNGETRTLPCEDGRQCRCRWCGREMA